MNFRKTSEGGVISDPQNFVVVFVEILRGKAMNFREKGGSKPKILLQIFSVILRGKNNEFLEKGG